MESLGEDEVAARMRVRGLACPGRSKGATGLMLLVCPSELRDAEGLRAFELVNAFGDLKRRDLELPELCPGGDRFSVDLEWNLDTSRTT